MERITREQAKYPLDFEIKTGKWIDFENKRSYKEYHKHLDAIFDYTESLEAKVKELQEKCNSLLLSNE